jgi:hypothetical protein
MIEALAWRDDMARWNSTTLALAAICVFQLGWITGSHGTSVAFADDQEAMAYALPKVRCAQFETSNQPRATLDTSDRTTEIGQWMHAQEQEGWQLYTVDFEIAQKPTGYAQTWVQVCVLPQG